MILQFIGPFVSYIEHLFRHSNRELGRDIGNAYIQTGGMLKKLI